MSVQVTIGQPFGQPRVIEAVLSGSQFGCEGRNPTGTQMFDQPKEVHRQGKQNVYFIDSADFIDLQRPLSDYIIKR